MFNKKRVEALERRMKRLEDEMSADQNWAYRNHEALHDDLNLLAKHIGVEFVPVCGRILSPKPLDKATNP